MNINPFAAMGNSPICMLLRAAQGGGDPVQVINQMAGRNPQMKSGLKMIQGKSSQQLEQMARNMAKERGTTVEEIAESLGIML